MTELTLSRAPAEPRPRAPAGPPVPQRRIPAWLALNLLSLAACVAAWAVATQLKLDLGVVTFRNVPSPLDVVRGAVAFAESGQATRHLVASIRRVLAGFGLAAVFGVGVGLLAGRLRLVRELAMPPLEVLRPIPAVAWIPLAILMFRSAEGSMIFITFLGALFPILLNTVHGVEGVDRRLIASARSLGARPAAVFREVIFPAALPSIVTGLVIGMGTSWFCLVTAEMISGQFGVGYYTWMSYTVQDYPGVVLGMVLIGVLGLGSSLAIRRLGDAFLGWRTAGAHR